MELNFYMNNLSSSERERARKEPLRYCKPQATRVTNDSNFGDLTDFMCQWHEQGDCVDEGIL